MTVTRKDFVDFLRDEGVLQQYIKALTNSFGGASKKVHQVRIDTGSVNQFSWGSNGGDDLWYPINKRWAAKYREINERRNHEPSTTNH